MPNLTIAPVESRQQQKMFLRLPWQIYQGDQYWVPPLRQDQKELLGFAPHPFYRDAQCQTFLALEDNRPVGRIAAIHNHAHLRKHDDGLGMFGFFESIDDQSVANGLFDAAGQWLSQQGLSGVRGPANPSMNYECGLLIDGFDDQPFFMMTYNRPYYQKLVENYGFEKSQDLYAFWGRIEMLETLDKKLEFITNECIRRFNLKMRHLDRTRFRDEVRTFLHLYNESNGAAWGFVPLSEAEVDHISKGLQYLIVPEMTSVAEVDGKVVAASFGLLDYNNRIKQIDGRLFPFGFVKLLWNKRAIKRVRLISTNVLPEYHRWGLGLVVLANLVPNALQWGIEQGEFSWVLESNDLSYKSLKRGGAQITKTYRMYDYSLK